MCLFLFISFFPETRVHVRPVDEFLRAIGSYKSADGDCTKEIKRRIALARQEAVVLASIWKDRNIKTPTKVKMMKSMVWAVFQYGVDGWTLKKSDRNRIEAFEMWCWRKMLSFSWQEQRTNDSILTGLGLERELMGSWQS